MIGIFNFGTDRKIPEIPRLQHLRNPGDGGKTQRKNLKTSRMENPEISGFRDFLTTGYPGDFFIFY